MKIKQNIATQGMTQTVHFSHSESLLPTVNGAALVVAVGLVSGPERLNV